jgi:hypothetical protein
MVHMVQIVYLSCVEITIIFKQTKTSFHFDEDILHYYPLAKTQQKKGQVA